MGIVVRVRQHRLWILAGACAAATIALLLWSYEAKRHPDEQAVSSAQDEVYEAVVRDMIGSINRQSRVTQLVFGDALLLNDGEGWGNAEACKEAVRTRMRWDSDALPYDSFIDKMYRFVTRGWIDGSVGTEAMQDFLEKSCTPGHLSRTFQTKVPRTFIPDESVHFEGWPIEKNGPPSFAKLFPGAEGIISLSRAGFNSSLNEAIVSASFACGGLCGSGWHFFLKKIRRRWQVVGKRMIWVS